MTGTSDEPPARPTDAQVGEVLALARDSDGAELSGEPGAEPAVGDDPGQVDSPMTLP
jgi:hypothetical protein